MTAPKNLDLSRVPQAIFERMMAYQHAEMAWMDAHVRAQWPRWVCWLAEKDGTLASLLRVFVARYSGLEVVRGKNMGVSTVGTSGRGFRPGRQPHKQMVDTITTTIFKHQKSCKQVVVAGGNLARPNCTKACIVERRVFDLGVPI